MSALFSIKFTNHRLTLVRCAKCHGPVRYVCGRASLSLIVHPLRIRTRACLDRPDEKEVPWRVRILLYRHRLWSYSRESCPRSLSPPSCSLLASCSFRLSLRSQHLIPVHPYLILRFSCSFCRLVKVYFHSRFGEHRLTSIYTLSSHTAISSGEEEILTEQRRSLLISSLSPFWGFFTFTIYHCRTLSVSSCLVFCSHMQKSYPRFCALCFSCNHRLAFFVAMHIICHSGRPYFY